MKTSELAERARRRTPGYALPAEFYRDPAIFEHDLDKLLLRRWFCAGHVSSLPRPGDYLLVELGMESLILVRGNDGVVKALLNVCRHRGSRLCSTAAGRFPAGRVTCPYHAWSYDLSGRLVSYRDMPETFVSDRFGLRALPVRVACGLIFTSFADHPPDFDAAQKALEGSAGVHGWERAKVAHRALYSLDANWKLAVENYMECYHCQPAHRDFARQHVYARPAAQVAELERAGRSRAEGLGIFIADLDQYGCAAPAGAESVSVFRSALSAGVDTGSADGGAVAPLMGRHARHDGNSTYFDIGPISDFLAYSDHGIIYRFIPRAVQHTDLEVLWLVDQEAVEGVDYDVQRLTWLWKTTSAEDKRIVEMNQEGVNSRFFEPGPYSLQESYANRFADWYLQELTR